MQKIILKKSSVANRVPVAGDLVYGELALNYSDGLLFHKTSSNLIDYFPSSSAVATLTNKTLLSATLAGDTVLTGEVLLNNGGGIGSSEGGELHLAAPMANTSLSGPIAIDIYENRLRIFETSGSNRGVYFDLSTAAASVGTNALYSGTLSSGTGIDQLLTITKTLTLSTDWQDTGIKSADLATGTYLVQLFANDVGSGGTNSNEYYSGTMSWYSGDTNSALEMPTDEITLHRAGGSGDGALYLRTYRTVSSNPDNLKLQIYSNTANASASNYVFKFRRMI
jgi:hypothetical protein